MRLNRVASLKILHQIPKNQLLSEQVLHLIPILPPLPNINNYLVKKVYICLVSATLRNIKIFF